MIVFIYSLPHVSFYLTPFLCPSLPSFIKSSISNFSHVLGALVNKHRRIKSFVFRKLGHIIGHKPIK
jgi:hypothetical protein